MHNAGRTTAAHFLEAPQEVVEDIVRRKLEAGMTVNQITKAIGYEKKYIRKVKKGKLCYH